MASEYIRFLTILECLKGENPDASIDSIEIQLLHYILLSHSKGRSLFVGDLIHLSEIASPASLHSRIKRLAALGYIKLMVCKGEARRRLVIPAKLADKYLVFMSRCIVKAVTESKH